MLNQVLPIQSGGRLYRNWSGGTGFDSCSGIEFVVMIILGNCVNRFNTYKADRIPSEMSLCQSYLLYVTSSQSGNVWGRKLFQIFLTIVPTSDRPAGSPARRTRRSGLGEWDILVTAVASQIRPSLSCRGSKDQTPTLFKNIPKYV